MTRAWLRKLTLFAVLPLLAGGFSMHVQAEAAGVTSDTANSVVSASVAREISISAADPQVMTLSHFLAGSSTGQVTVTSTIASWDVSIRDQQTSTPGEMDRTNGVGPLSLAGALDYKNQLDETKSLTAGSQLLHSGATVETFAVPFSQSLLPNEDVVSGDGYLLTVTYSAVASDSVAPTDSAPLSLSTPTLQSDGGSEPWKSGETLTASAGSWTGQPTPTVDYQMQRCATFSPDDCSNITAATSSSYQLTSADQGKFVRVSVTATNYLGSAIAYSSLHEVAASTTPVFTSLPVLYGTPTSSGVVAVSTGIATSSNEPTYTIQWQIAATETGSWQNLDLATSSNFSPARTQIGSWLRASITATNSDDSAVAQSQAVQVVDGNFKPVNTAAPTIVGQTRQGFTAVATNGSWLSDPSPSFTYQWKSCSTSSASDCSDISGATSVNYMPVAIDVGKYLKVTVAASNVVDTTYASSSASLVTAAALPANTTPPAVTGTRQEDSTLHATSGTWTGAPTPTLSYRWQRSADGLTGWAFISGQTSSSYTLTEDDISSRVRVVVTGTNVGGAVDAVSSAGSAIAVHYILTNTASPEVTGTFRQGENLTASSGQWTQKPAATFSYQWQRCDSAGVTCSNIAGATASSYRLQAADVSSSVRIHVSATNGGLTDTAQSTVHSIAAAEAPQNTSAPVVSGAGSVDSTLTVTSGSWTGQPTPTISYQWQRSLNDGASWSNIAGATTSSHVVTSADYQQLMRAVVTATNVAAPVSFESQTIRGTAVGPVNLTPATISGQVMVASTLTATAGTWSGTPAPDLSYQWQRSNDGLTGWSNISGAQSSTYVTTSSDYGKYVRVNETASNEAASPSEPSSNSVLVDAVLPTVTSAPTVSGTPRHGDLLTAAKGSWIGTTTISYSYQWQSSADGSDNWTNIDAATASTYTALAGQVGGYLRVQVAATNLKGTATESSSGQLVLAAIAPLNTVAPAVSGTATENQTLTATAGTWSGDPVPSFSYQWQTSATGTGTSGWSNINGATSSSYRLTSSDVDQYIRVSVTATNVAASPAAASLSTAKVIPAVYPPVNTVAPVASGTWQQGYTLTVAKGTWTGTPTPSYAYQWQRSETGTDGWSNISGATSASYTLLLADVNQYVRARVAGTNSGATVYAYTQSNLTEAGVAPAFDSGPTVSGSTTLTSATTGQTLTASAVLTGQPTPSVSYQWQSSTDNSTWNSISGATSTTYVIPRTLVSSYVRVRMTASNVVAPASANSASGLQVDQMSPLFTSNPTISGIYRVGEVVSATSGSASGLPSPTMSGKWQRAATASGTWADISLADSPTYTTTTDDLGKFLRYLASAANTAGTATAASSTKQITAAITNTVAPALSGTMQVASTLTTSEGTWTGTDPTFETQWYRCDAAASSAVTVSTPSGCTAIDAATTSSYLVDAADANYFIRSAVTASNSSTTVTVFSAATTRVAASLSATEYQVCSAGATTCYPNYVSSGPDGEVWVTNRDSNQLARVNASGGVSLYGTSLASGTKPGRLVLGANNRLWMANGSSSAPSVAAFTVNGADATSITASNYTTLTAVNDLTVGAEGGTWFAAPNASNNDALGYYTSNGSRVIKAITSANPSLVARASDDSMFWVDPYQSAFNPGAVKKVNSASNQAPVTTLPSVATEMKLGSGNTMWFLTASRNSLHQVNVNSGSLTEVTGFSGSSSMRGLAVTPDGAVWTLSNSNNRLLRYGTVGADAGSRQEYFIDGLTTSSGSAGLNQLNYVNGKMWVTATSTGRVLKVAVPVGESAETAPVNTTLPSVTGTITSGNVATASAGSWSGWPRAAYTYQWQRCAASSCTDISGATAASYTITDDDMGLTLRATVTATSSAGSPTANSSETSMVPGTTPVNTAAPTMSGAALDGATLTATSDGTWTGKPAAQLSYQWMTCTDSSDTAACSVIDGATSSSYLIAGQGNRFIRLRVSGSNVAGYAYGYSTASTQVPGVPDNTSLPTITPASSLVIGTVMTAATGNWTATPAASYSYQWQRCDSAGDNCSDITDATSSTYTLSSDDSNLRVKAVVTATNSEGSFSVTSADSAKIRANAYSTRILADTPELYYELDEAAAPSVASTLLGSGTMNIGAAVGRRAAGSGTNSYGMTLNGTGGIGATSVPLTANASAYTMEVWVKSGNLSQNGGSSTIMSNSNYGRVALKQGTCGDGTGAVNGSCLRLLYDGKAWVDTNWSFPNTTSWHHLVATRDTSGNTRIYVDGVQRGTTYSGTPLYNSTYANLGSSYIGSIDDAAFYNKGLSAAVVLAHYNAR